MTTLDAKTTVGALVAEKPARARVFERLGIDYCCGGKVPLEEACADRGLDASAVIRELAAADRAPRPDAVDWTKAPLTGLVDHIVEVHHGFLRRELPRLEGLVAKIAAVHGPRHPELGELRDVFAGLKAEIEMHLFKEERALFPMIRQLEGAATRPAFHCGTLGNPIAVMEDEHESAGRALARMRELTGGYATPADGCNTYRAAMEALAGLEADLHEHIHEENNILFPRAAGLERSLPEE